MPRWWEMQWAGETSCNCQTTCKKFPLGLIERHLEDSQMGCFPSACWQFVPRVLALRRKQVQVESEHLTCSIGHCTLGVLGGFLGLLKISLEGGLHGVFGHFGRSFGFLGFCLGFFGFRCGFLGFCLGFLCLAILSWPFANFVEQG